jgi:hypothetical protein
MRDVLVSLLGAATAIAAVATLPLGILAFIYLGAMQGVTVFVVGWLLAVPLFAILAGVVGGEANLGLNAGSGVAEEAVESAIEGELTGDEDDEADADPLETLRERYATGEIDEAEFERRVDRLLETDESEYGSRAARSDREPGAVDRESTAADREYEYERE